MSLTKEKIESLHPVYKDFMMALKPIMDSRAQPFQIRGFPTGQVYDASARKYGFDPHQFHEIAENLRREGLIERDRFGYYYPTGLGEHFIHVLTADQPDPSRVPPLQLED